MLDWIILISGILIPYFLYFSIGKGLIHFTENLCSRCFSIKGTVSDAEGPRGSETILVFTWFLGLIAHLSLSFLVYHLNFDLRLSYLLSIIVLSALFFPELRNNILLITHLDFRKLYPGLSFTIYFWFIVILGTTILDASVRIRTPWLNNYGDLMFHLGMIFNFSFSKAPLTEYHIFPGEILSYPYLINFWSSALWPTATSWVGLSFVFIVQWTTVWLGAFFVLRKGMFGFLPWLLLFSGGSFPILISQLGWDVPNITSGLSHLSLDKGYPITVFLTSIWIPQRGSILGLILSLVSLCMVLEILPSKEPNTLKPEYKIALLICAGLMLGVGLFAHFFFCGIIAAYIFAVLVCDFFKSRERFFESTAFLLSFLVSSIPALLLFRNKSGMIEKITCWMYDEHLTTSLSWFPDLISLPSNQFSIMLSMWVLNLGVWLIVLPILFLQWKIRFTLPLIVLFLMGNFIQASVWNWDNIKIFLVLIIIVISLLRYQTRTSIVVFMLLVLSTAPSIYETWFVVSKGQWHTVYSENQLEVADAIRLATPDDAIIATKPSHDTPVTIAGRKVFVGGPGWLNSHSIDYREREKLNYDINKLIKCKSNESIDNDKCPAYIYNLDSQGKTFLEYDIHSPLMQKTRVRGLYKLSSTE